MSEFIMTLSDEEVSNDAIEIDSSSDEEKIDFEFLPDSMNSLLDGTVKNVWNFNKARKGLEKSSTNNVTIDQIIRRNELESVSKDSKKQKKRKAKEEIVSDSEKELNGINESGNSHDSYKKDSNNSFDDDSDDDSDDGTSENPYDGDKDSENLSNEDNDDDNSNNSDDNEISDNDNGDISSSCESNSDYGELSSSSGSRDMYNKEKICIEDSNDELNDISLKYKKKSKKIEKTDDQSTFSDFYLSRPILKALSELNFIRPTSIQSKCIPLILKGGDVFASAVTGSGKTAAFVLPILERLLHRPKEMTTRVLILIPTRELAVQCQSVIESFSRYSNGITVSLITGGMNSKQQELELRSKPDIIVATPGRVIDHLLNTMSFALDKIEILVLDEADRLLELGFTDQIEQVVKSCPHNRQTLLFSATLTDRVEALAKMSLRQASQVELDPMCQLSHRLTQEFIRVRRAEDREAILLSLCTRKFTNKTLIFCTKKSVAHRIKIVMTLAGLKIAEFHGDLTQTERFDSLEYFRDGKVDFLVASDIASRGLDVIGIETVINFELPINLITYVHRVGRTARAGTTGRSIGFVLEEDRHLFKKIIKHSSGDIKKRVIPRSEIEKWSKILSDYEERFDKILEEEKTEKMLRKTEMELQKTENIITHHSEIKNRPEKTWYVTNKEKKKIAEEAKDNALKSKDVDYDSEKSKSKKRASEKHITRKQKRRKLLSTTTVSSNAIVKRNKMNKFRRPEKPKDKPKSNGVKKAKSSFDESFKEKRKKSSGFHSKKKHKRR